MQGEMNKNEYFNNLIQMIVKICEIAQFTRATPDSSLVQNKNEFHKVLLNLPVWWKQFKFKWNVIPCYLIGTWPRGHVVPEGMGPESPLHTTTLTGQPHHPRRRHHPTNLAASVGQPSADAHGKSNDNQLSRAHIWHNASIFFQREIWNMLHISVIP